MYYRFVKAFNY